MLREEYLFFDVDVSTKEEALTFISHKALELELTDDEEGLKEDFMKREEEYSTGLQDGFAIPHAKSDFAKKMGIFYLRCKNSIPEWETMDDEKVTDLFALIVPKESADNRHLMMISRLATGLLEVEFKEIVKTALDKKELIKYLKQFISKGEEN
ncbi:PTS sugar transporter subunit IIA [Lacrimispora sp.]|jgi:PTS system fructose-specific IIA component|uniref:PTS sugar transporter subunit IIA n=1 Tax=Lacrimispora sp. TaxID=2719234 RepID=UPI0028B2686B|nr:PTS sugar transporter subunit IIA [Lacrimispora sp.]